jgi:hypothetical protein
VPRVAIRRRLVWLAASVLLASCSLVSTAAAYTYNDYWDADPVSTSFSGIYWGDPCNQDYAHWSPTGYFYPGATSTCQWPSNPAPQYHNWMLTYDENIDAQNVDSLVISVWKSTSSLPYYVYWAPGCFPTNAYVLSSAVQSYWPDNPAIAWRYNGTCTGPSGGRWLAGWAGE